jgi:beta-N-acetylhexosaminidase
VEEDYTEVVPLAHRPGRLLSLAALLLLTACSKPTPGPPPAPQPPARTIDWWASHLTLEEKVGQLFWFGLPGPDLSPEAAALVKEGKAGGFILFARNAQDPDQVADLTSGLQRLTFERGRPTPGLVISVDQEGGLVERFKAPFTSWPGAMAIGATGNPERAAQVGAAIAQELKAVGINMNLAPVADVNNNPANPVIGVRSFGADPAQVSQFVAAAVQGTQAEGVSAVAKHFPGHGDTGVDSHRALPVIRADRHRLDQVELVPFRAAIRAGVDAVMVGHISFPALEPDGLPATLSPRVIRDLLKGELGFQGVVVTDAIDTMKAITDHWGKSESFIKAVQAGADALLVTESFGQQAALYEAVLEAVQSGQISAERLDDAVRRNLALKAKRGLLRGVGGGAPEVKHPVSLGTSGLHQRLADEVGRDALTLVKGTGLPPDLTGTLPLLVVSPSFLPVGADGLTDLGRSVKQVYMKVTEVRIDRKPTAEQIQAVRQAAVDVAGIIYAVDGVTGAHQTLISELAASRRFALVGLGEPYDLADVPTVPTYLATYGYRAPNLRSVGVVLLGKGPARGRLPVSLP